MEAVLNAAGGPNEYDTRTYNPYSNILRSTATFNRFLSNPVNQEALHVRGTYVHDILFEFELHDTRCTHLQLRSRVVGTVQYPQQ
jgi:hypothetical protein